MFDLIERAESYPEFLPWCTGATILERNDDWVAARLDFSYLKLRFSVQTRNPKRRPEWLHVRLVEGPFRHFEGNWRLTPLGDIGCKVEFDLSYEIAAGLLDQVALPAVEFVSRSMVDAFVRRAERILPFETRAESSGATAQPLEPIPSAHPTQPSEIAMTASDTGLEDIVRASPLGRDLSPSQVARLAGLVELQSHAARQVLAREGTIDNHLVVVVSGTLEVVKHLGTPNESMLTTLHAGDLAHELGFLDGTPRYATLVAASEARVLVLERERLESLIDTDPRILYAIMCAIVRTVHAVQTRLSVQATELMNYVVKQHGRY